MGADETGAAMFTKPPPLLRAAIPASATAPDMLREPPTKTTRPKSPLCESWHRSGSCLGVVGGIEKGRNGSMDENVEVYPPI